ncbi:MAG: acetylglutamate kinase [Paracoccaceae bacterium]|nr:acetylglutamate kinase [Paracoccaceae bacterium]
MAELKTNVTDSVSAARTLAQALPYIQRYDGATIVIKLGGHAMSDDTAMANFAQDIVLMKQCNLNPIIVHGGGPAINNFLEKVQIKSKFIDGKRVTDSESIPIVEMVLSGSVNKNIVSAINKKGGKAIGLSGKDADLMICEPDNPKLGFVGKPSKINPEILKSFLASDFIPVVAPIGIGKDGQTYNVNADTAAGAIASALLADRLLLLTDVDGVKNKEGNLLTKLSISDLKELIADGSIIKGMIPKTQTAIKALQGGVRAAVILDGRAQNACLLELFTDYGSGTLIRK